MSKTETAETLKNLNTPLSHAIRAAVWSGVGSLFLALATAIVAILWVMYDDLLGLIGQVAAYVVLGVVGIGCCGLTVIGLGSVAGGLYEAVRAIMGRYGDGGTLDQGDNDDEK